jgi:hypothetical protein
MPTITYKGRQVSVTDAAAQQIATMDAASVRTPPLMVEQTKGGQGAAAAQTRSTPCALFTRESREAGCAQLRAQNEANRAFWAAQRS